MQPKLIEFFKKCYQADNRSENLWDIFSKKHAFLQMYNEEDLSVLLQGKNLVIDDLYGKKLFAKVTAYRREKQFVLGTDFIIGRIANNSHLSKAKTRKICAPLFLWECEIQHDQQQFTIAINPTSSRLNFSLLTQLFEDTKKLEDTIETYNAFGGFTEIESLKTSLISQIQSYKINSLDTYHATEEDIKSLSTKTQKGQLMLTRGAATLMIDRSRSSRGIVDELSNLQKAVSSSPPLRVFDKTVEFSPSKRKSTVNINNIPGILSNAQSKSCEVAANEPLSLLIGPPGTGKSYTIASIALEHFMRGETVLVVSQNEHAVDVIKEKLVEQLGLSQSAAIRAGAKDYHKNLKSYLDRIVKWQGVEKPQNSQSSILKKLTRDIKRMEAKLTKFLRQEERNGILLSQVETRRNKPGFFDKFRLWYSENRLKKHGLLERNLVALQKLHKSREQALSTHINNNFATKVYYFLANHKKRKQLINFRQALGARTSQRQESLYSLIDFASLLETMPIWLCSLDALHRSLPLKNELFDLVIIDEATQCDIASCLPALYRAKRAMIVGDPKQLRHMSFLSRDRQKILMEQSGLDSLYHDISYRDHSMIDYTAQYIPSQNACVTLDEHYRSAPEIIHFSNERFYDSKLRLMTDKPSVNQHTALELHPVKDGSRTNGINKVEATAIIEKLKSLIQDQKTIPDQYKLSLGIVSFYRAQAEYLHDLIYDKLNLDDITKHAIRAGTPYAFQGEERDVILISCVVDNDTPNASYVYMNREDVFNVGITRARELQLIFLSAQPTSLPAKSLLSSYIRSTSHKPKKYIPNLEQRDKNIEDLSTALMGLDIIVLVSYPVAGIEMDLVLMHQGCTLAIDLVGFPGALGDAFHLDRYKIFERAQLTIIPISYTAWRFRREEVLETIKRNFVKLKEKNTLSNIAVADLSHHWTKLLAIDPILAENVRKIEADLISLRDKVSLSLLGNLIAQYQKVIWVLNEKLSPTELTYSRYAGSSEQVLINGIENLSQLILMTRSLSVNTNDMDQERLAVRAQQDKKIQQLKLEINNAILSLEKLALKWSHTKTFSPFSATNMNDALSDLQDLSKRVEQYE